MNAADVPTELFHAFEIQRTSFDAAPFPDCPLGAPGS